VEQGPPSPGWWPFLRLALGVHSAAAEIDVSLPKAPSLREVWLRLVEEVLVHAGWRRFAEIVGHEGTVGARIGEVNEGSLPR